MGDQHPAATLHVGGEGDFTFGEVVARLWRGRVVLVLLPLLAGLAGLAAILATEANDRKIISYHVKLIGIEDGTYPNGTAFSPHDLKSAAVLAELSEKFNLPASRLEVAISINYDNPAAAGIALKYQQKLNTRNLAPAVIDSINNAYTEELAASVNSGLRIEVNNALLNLPAADAASLAFAIPSTWNEVYLKRHRVLADTKLTETAVTPIPEPLSGTTRLIVTGEQLGRIESGLKLMSEDNRLSGLTTAEGLTADDMKNLISEFRSVYFDPLIAGGFSPSDTVAMSQKKSLERRIEDLARQIQGLDQNLARLTGERPVQPPESLPMQGSGFEQSVLDTIIALVKRASYVTYTQELLDKRQKLVEELSTAQSRLDALIFRDNPNDVVPSPVLTDAAETKLKALASTYRDLFLAAQRQLVETSGRFYSERSSPASAPQYSRLGSSELILACALAGFLIAALYALFAPSIRSAIRAKRPHTPASLRMVSASERA